MTTSQVMTAATATLVDGGYTAVPAPAEWPSTARLFEDAYGIVAVHIYDTWQQLVDGWPIAQGMIVDLITEHLHSPEPKAWDGYLVLLTGGSLSPSERSAAGGIRYDTNRVRKLVATGEDLETLDDIRVALLPLLPLVFETPDTKAIGVLDQLPSALAGNDISIETVQIIVDAFTHNESILERLYGAGTSQ
ncbi:MAG: hypothetical protein WAL64_07785 [Candidatus Dormiibacterota bacterium]